MLIPVSTREEVEAWHEFDVKNIETDWAPRVANTMELLVEQNKFWREHQRGMGASKGHSHEGVVEARIPLEVLLLKMQQNPNFLQDDKEFYGFLNRQPNFRAYNYKKAVTV